MPDKEVVILSGWCMIIGPRTAHRDCKRRNKSSQTGVTYVCPCPCHTETDKALEELI